MIREFDYFVGVDWSGARGPYQAGIAVFLAHAGQQVPQRIAPPKGKYWARQQVCDWLLSLSATGRVLAGIDFAFAYPVTDMDGLECGYFPGYKNCPNTAPSLWRLIERVNQDQLHLYGGGIWDHPQLGAYYNAPSGRRGAKFFSRRRQTELHARTLKAPSPTFNCVGPAGVGTGSLAGMRLLHQIQRNAEIWPFDSTIKEQRALTVVEIFPSYYFAMAGVRAVGGIHGKVEVLNKVLSYFNSEGLTPDFVPAGPDFDEADALISAAALRNLSADKTLWHTDPSAKYEGWIFGVK